MKNRSKFVGIIALVALIGFMGVSCDDGGTTNVINHVDGFPAPTVLLGDALAVGVLNTFDFTGFDDFDDFFDSLPYGAVGILDSAVTPARRNAVEARLLDEVQAVVTAFTTYAFNNTAVSVRGTDIEDTPFTVSFDWGAAITGLNTAGVDLDAREALAAAGIFVEADAAEDRRRSGAFTLNVTNEPAYHLESGRYTLSTTPVRVDFEKGSGNNRFFGRISSRTEEVIDWNATREWGTTNTGWTAVVGFVVEVASATYFGTVQIQFGNSSRFNRLRWSNSGAAIFVAHGDRTPALTTAQLAAYQDPLRLERDLDRRLAEGQVRNFVFSAVGDVDTNGNGNGCDCPCDGGCDDGDDCCDQSCVDGDCGAGCVCSC